MALEFRLDGQARTLPWGGSVKATPEKVYREVAGDRILKWGGLVKGGIPWRQVVEQEIAPENPWLAKIICHDKRNDFLPLVVKSGVDFVALDVGSGWGQHTVELAKQGAVCSVEPSPERFEFMRAICQQEVVSEQCAFINATLGQLEFGPLFDFAVSIGVLEWVGVFECSAPPRVVQRTFLERIKASLKSGAPLVVGIENRLGLKYLLGSNDDHIGARHIACLDYESANREWAKQGKGELRSCTYSMREYETLFREAGFVDVVFHAALPDYKIPELIVECHPTDKLSARLAGGEFVEEHDGSNGVDCGINPQLKSLYKTLGEEGVAPLFAPSYFIVAR